MNTKKRLGIIGKNIIMWLISITIFIPIILVLVNSVKDQIESSSMGVGLPKQWHFENYLVVIEKGKLAQSFFNSLLYSSISVCIVILVTSMAAFVLSRRRNKLTNVIYFYFTLGIALPMNYVSLTKVMQLTHLNNTQLGICLLYAAMQIPFTAFLMYGFIGTVPREVDEAGMIDGYNPLQLFFSLIFPLLKPIIVTTIVLTFMNTWNEFVTPLYYLPSSKYWPMTLAVYNFFGQYKVNWNLVCADIVLTSIPVVMVYIIGQKYIVSGMTTGAVKG